MWELLILGIFMLLPAPSYRGAGITLFRNKGTEVLLVADGNRWNFPANQTDTWDISLEETATRSLYAHTGWEDGRDYILCTGREFRIGAYAFFTAHARKSARFVESPYLRWVPLSSLREEAVMDPVKYWSGQKTCHIL
jgi:hypothetical protein